MHRDVKPSNIMLTLDGETKLIDFGIAAQLDGRDGHLTAAGTFIGSYDYAAPEQLKGEIGAIGPWTDIYAFGATLYEMLTQRTPFEAPSYADRLAAADLQPPKRPRDYNPQVSRTLDAVVMHALAPRPEERYQDGAELAHALRHCGTRAIGLPAVSGRRVRRLLRSPWLVACAAVIAMAVLAIRLRQKSAELALLQRQVAVSRMLDLKTTVLKQAKAHETDLAMCIQGIGSMSSAARRNFEVQFTVVNERVTSVRRIGMPNVVSPRMEHCLLGKLASFDVPGHGISTEEAVLLSIGLDIPVDDDPTQGRRSAIPEGTADSELR